MLILWHLLPMRQKPRRTGGRHCRSWQSQAQPEGQRKERARVPGHTERNRRGPVTACAEADPDTAFKEPGLCRAASRDLWRRIYAARPLSQYWDMELRGPLPVAQIRPFGPGLFIALANSRSRHHRW